MDEVAARGRAGARPRASSPPSAAAPDGKLIARALQRRVPGRARPRPRSCCARRRRSPQQPTLKALPRDARRRLPLQRLLRERRGLDGAGRAASSPPSGPTRSTRTSGSTTRPPSRPSSPCATTRRRRSWRSSAAELQELENHLPIDPKLRNPKLGALAPIRVVNVVFSAGDAQPRRADRRLQPAQRRARGEGEGHQARDAQERAGGQVPARCCCPSPRWRSPPADRKDVAFDAFFTHILMHELMHGLGPHNITVDGQADHGAPGAAGVLQRARGGQGGHLRPVGAAVPGGQGRARQGAGAHHVHDVPRLRVPLHPLRHRRGARQGHRAAAQLLPRRGRGQGERGRHLRGGAGEDQGRRRRR